MQTWSLVDWLLADLNCHVVPRRCPNQGTTRGGEGSGQISDFSRQERDLNWTAFKMEKC